MKKVLLLSLLVPFFLISKTNAQCPVAGTLYGSGVAPTTSCVSVQASPGCHYTSSSSGDYAKFTSLVSGNTYKITSSATTGTSIPNNDELTIYLSTNLVTGNHVAYGTGGTVTFSPVSSGDYVVIINKSGAACGTAESVCRYISIQCTSCPAPTSITTQPLTSNVTAGTIDNQILRMDANVCGETVTSISFATTGSTDPTTDITNAKVYYTTTTTFSTVTQYGTTVTDPNGSFTVIGSQVIGTVGYFWLTYDLKCGAVGSNIVDGECTSFVASGSGTVTPSPLNPTGTRAITASSTTITTNQPSTGDVAIPSNDNQVLRVQVTSCANSIVTQLDLATTGSTNPGTDITTAKVYFTTTTTFSTSTLFGSQASPNGAFTIAGSQVLTSGTGYFWLVYDIPGSATNNNVVDAECTSVTKDANTFSPGTTNPIGTRKLVIPPANDECVGAIALTVNADLVCGVTTNANTANATQSTETAPSCNVTGIDDDIWYSFMATGAKHTLVLSSASVTMAAQVYSGSCGSLVLLSGACASTTSGTVTMNLTGLTNGTTYRVRVYTTATSGNGTVTLCIGTPVGTSCSDAVVISSLPYSSGTRTTCGSVDDYAAGSYCNANYGGGEDYVFALTISNAPITVNFALGGAATWKIASVHSACPPTSGNCLIGFTTSSGTTASGCYQFATNGTYYIYIDTWPTPTCGEFTLDLTTNTPANDACINATNLTVNPDQACGTVTPGSTTGASQSTEADPSCNASGVDDDVWYSFSATATSQEVKITGATSITGFALYSGTCGALTQVSGACGTTASGTGSFISTGLTISNIYYVRVFSTAVGCAASSSFNVCIGTLSACPAPTALMSSMITGTSAILTWNENAGATNWDISYGVATLGDPNTGTIINTSTKPYTLNPPLSPSTTYDWYLRSYCGGTPSAWSSKSTFSTLLANDNCSGAISLTVSNSATCGSTTNGTTVGATSSGVNGCAGTPDDDVWYSFVAIASTQTITVVGASGFDAVVDLRYGVCNGSNISCADVTLSGGTETITNSTLTVGATYYVRVYDFYTAAYGAFTICVTTPSSYFVGSGNWSDASKWTGGVLPTCSRNVIINAGASCTIDMAAVVGNLTINGTVNLASNSLTTGCLSNGGNTIFSISSTGNLVMDGGTLTINGNFVMTSGGKFSQTGGDILIDPNTGSPGTSVASGTVIMALSNSTSGNIVWSGGTITFVDPPLGSSGYTISYASASGIGLTPSGGHTVIMGGSSTTAGGYPFEVNTSGTSAKSGFYNLTVAGGSGTNRHTSTVTSGATVTVLNSLQIFSGSEYRGGTLNIATGLVNNGTLTTTTLLGLQSYNLNQSSVAMASSNVCTISGSGVWRNLVSSATANMTSLTVNNTSGTPISIPNSMVNGTGTGSVSGTLTLTSGILDIGGGTFTLGTSGTSGTSAGTLTGGSSSAYIIGIMKRWVNAAIGARLFPIGTASSYYGATINFTVKPTTAGSLTAQYYEGDAGSTGLPLVDGIMTPKPYANTLCTSGYWQIDAGNSFAGGTYIASLLATSYPCVTDYATTRLLKRTTGGGNPWTLAGTFATGTGSNGAPTVIRSGLTGFSQFAVSQGESSPLPVELTTFKGEAREKANMLSWQTASEINSAKYLVERAPEADNALFTPIGEVNAKGNTTTTSDYSFMDEKPLAESYYRLKIMDNDGSFEYSKIIVLQNASSGTGHVNVYPVPAHNAITLAFQCNYSDDVKVVITDMNGRIVKEVSIAANKGQNTNEINIENLPMGMYHAHIYGADIESNVRIIRN